MKNKILFLYLFFILNINLIFSQKEEKIVFNNLEKMLANKESISLKKAVFSVENCYWGGNLNETKFQNSITNILDLVKIKIKGFNLSKYELKDSISLKYYQKIFETFTTPTKIIVSNDSFTLTPYKYNFYDMFGEKDWSNMFVTKLLATHKGNCHSMPYLYKILCDELGIPCHLALSPSHIYIKHRSEKVGWYNTELTSASFPIDAWIMASGYITLEAIQNGIYMDALDDKKCITLCVYDLAKGFDRKYPDNDGTFIIKCCDLALEHFPNFINALILKAETKKKQFERMMKERNISTPSVLKQQKDGKELWNDFTKLYVTIHNLGYRTMPEKMYLDWLLSLKKEREKYSNKQVSEMNKN